MSRSLAANAGALDSLKVRTRCGRSLWARQIRCTELMLIPTAAAMALAVQWVASCGGSVGVSSTTRSIVACARGGMRDGRGLSRSRPATPSRTNLSCQRQTHGLDLPVRRTISPVPRPSAVARTILARQTCFCGLFLSAGNQKEDHRAIWPRHVDQADRQRAGHRLRHGMELREPIDWWRELVRAGWPALIGNP